MTKNILILFCSLVLFSACTSKVSTQIDSTQEVTPTASPEAMMDDALATPQPTPIDISVDAQLKGTSSLKTTDEEKDLSADLESTTIVNESFN